MHVLITRSRQAHRIPGKNDAVQKKLPASSKDSAEAQGVRNLRVRQIKNRAEKQFTIEMIRVRMSYDNTREFVNNSCAGYGATVAEERLAEVLISEGIWILVIP